MKDFPAFTPNAADPAALEDATVGRTQLLDTLVARIRSAARDGSRPHTLLLAPQGSGKTHTLHVAVHRALADPDTAARVVPALLPEGVLPVGSYLDLLTEIARCLGPEVHATARALRRARDPIGIEAAVGAAASGRMLLLAVENLDRVFDRLGETGQGSLRAWVETSTDVLVVGTAPTLFPGVSSRTMPWYGSFIVDALPPLGLDDCLTLFGAACARRGRPDLASFAASVRGRARLAVVHRLIGGAPRSWLTLTDAADLDALEAVTPAVELVLDRIAPQYQHRLWELAAGEQRLVVELARSAGARTVGDLADAVGVSNQSAATALGRLADAHWVTSSKAPDGDRRTTWYDLADPLLRLVVHFRDGDRGALDRAVAAASE